MPTNYRSDIRRWQRICNGFRYHFHPTSLITSSWSSYTTKSHWMIRNDQVAVRFGDLWLSLITLSFEALVGKCVSVHHEHVSSLALSWSLTPRPWYLFAFFKHFSGLQRILSIRPPRTKRVHHLYHLNRSPFLPVDQSVTQPWELSPDDKARPF